jgi:hypothetical protein
VRVGWGVAADRLLLDMTVYGRQETWEDSPAGWPQDPTQNWFRRDGRPIPQWTRPGVSARAVTGTGAARPQAPVWM